MNLHFVSRPLLLFYFFHVPVKFNVTFRTSRVVISSIAITSYKSVVCVVSVPVNGEFLSDETSYSVEIYKYIKEIK